MEQFFEKPENIIVLSASGGGVLLITIVVILAVKLARDRKRPQQSDNNVNENNNQYDGVYQYVEGEEMTETQLNTSENGQPGERQNLLAIYKSEW